MAPSSTAGKKITISYPCIMLNADVHDNYTNHQVSNTTQHDTTRHHHLPPRTLPRFPLVPNTHEEYRQVLDEERVLHLL